MARFVPVLAVIADYTIALRQAFHPALSATGKV
jgi:hypothetical protein